MIHPITRFISYCFAGLLAVLIAIPSFAAQPSHSKSPLLVRGPQAVPSGYATPQYGLFRCQVGIDPFGRTCYDPYQMRHAYGVDALIAAGNDGTGHTIVIVDAFQNPNLVSQIAFYNNFYGLPPTNLTLVDLGVPPFDPSDGNMVGWAEEISLDVEWAHNIAPGAKIVLVMAKSNEDIDILSAVTYAVNNNLGDVISMSFGENESCVDPDMLAAYHGVFAAATQKGITLFASSGDQGASQPTCDGNSWTQAASHPASDPLVTGVGGTELRAAGYCIPGITVPACNPGTAPAPGTWLSEVVWNEGPTGDFSNLLGSTEATGGGFSVLFDVPSWQQSTLPGGKQRGVPDVAYSAAIFHGALTYLNIPGIPAGFYLFGGTSCGSPQWSAILAIANQKAGGRLGFLSKAIYDIGKVSKKAQASFHDITSGNNSAVEFDSGGNEVDIAGFLAGPGWDATTGFGSPINPSLVDSLIAGVSSGDGQSAISTTKPKPHPKPSVPGHANPH